MTTANLSPLPQEAIMQKGINLKSFIEALISEKGAVLVNMSNLKFDDIEACNINLQNINLYGSWFSNALMQCANFMDANLEKVSFRRSNLGGACFRGARLDNAIFAENSLVNADFRAPNLQLATRHHSTSFCGSDLRGANLSGLSIENPDFTGCDLRGADLSRCNFMGGNFTNANLQSANLMNANIADGVFMNANLRHTNLFGTKMFGANISGANIAGFCMPLICDNKTVKTDYNQRVILMNFLLHWIAGSDDITEIERNIYETAKLYADDSQFQDAVSKMTEVETLRNQSKYISVLKSDAIY